MSDLDLRNVRAIVTDANVVGRLDPDTVADYLSHTGWTWTHRSGLEAGLRNPRKVA